MYYKDQIFEYDIRKCNISVLRSYSYISDELYHELYNKDNHQRHVDIGMMCQDKEFNQKLDSAIKASVAKFKVMNNILDKDVIEVAKDAVWINNKVIHTKLDDYIEFICKREATSRFVFRKVKFYYNSYDGSFFQRGLGKKEFAFYEIIKRAMNFAENDLQELLYTYLHDTKLDYLEKRLPDEYYVQMINGKDNIDFLDQMIKDMIK